MTKPFRTKPYEDLTLENGRVLRGWLIGQIGDVTVRGGWRISGDSVFHNITHYEYSQRAGRNLYWVMEVRVIRRINLMGQTVFLLPEAVVGVIQPYSWLINQARRFIRRYRPEAMILVVPDITKFKYGDALKLLCAEHVNPMKRPADTLARRVEMLYHMRAKCGGMRISINEHRLAIVTARNRFYSEERIAARVARKLMGR